MHFVIHWPQAVMLGIMAVELSIYAVILDGHEKTGTWSLSSKMLDTAIVAGLLYAGGFFG
jgi:hypothetical protein